MKRQQKKRRHVTIVYSCLTGKAVWVNIGKSDNPRMTYWRACKAELERIRRWSETVAERKAWIKKFLNACMERLPMMSELPEEKRKAAKSLLAMAEVNMPCDMEFYNHIVEEARRRNAASKRWVERRSKKYGM